MITSPRKLTVLISKTKNCERDHVRIFSEDELSVELSLLAFEIALIDRRPDAPRYQQKFIRHGDEMLPVNADGTVNGDLATRIKIAVEGKPDAR